MAFTPYRDQQGQAAAEADALLRAAAALLQDFPDPVMLAAEDGRVLWANDSAASIFFARSLSRGTQLTSALHGSVLSGLLASCTDTLRSPPARLRINELRNGEVEAMDCEASVHLVASTRPDAPLPRIFRILVRLLPADTHAEGDACRRALREARTPLSVIAGYAENLAEGEISDPASTRQATLALLRQTRRLQQILESAQ